MFENFYLFQLAIRANNGKPFPKDLTELIGEHLVAQQQHELYQLKFAIQEMQQYVNRPNKSYNNDAYPLSFLNIKAQEIESCTSLELMRPLLQEYYNDYIKLRNSQSEPPEQSTQQAINNMEEIVCSLFRVSHYVTPNKEIDMNALKCSAIYSAVHDARLEDITFIMKEKPDISALGKKCFVYVEELNNYKNLELNPLQYASYRQKERKLHVKLSQLSINQALEDAAEDELIGIFTDNYNEAKKADEDLTEIINIFEHSLARKANKLG